MPLNYETDTISAVATAFGAAGVGIIRLSGNKSFEIVEKIFPKKLIPQKIMYGKTIDEGQIIDEVIILPFKAPSGYTGEDCVEIQCHGGLNLIKKILEITYKYGARPPERGEFTKRAFLNGKMDLSQAESVLDIIHAKTSDFAIKSVQNLSGKLSHKINEIYEKTFQLVSKIVASVDFPEDVQEVPYEYLEKEVDEIIFEIQNIYKFAKNSNILRQGVNIAIIGKPNAGKSSLFNELLNMERAIVTDIAGTTRDAIYETINIDGIAATLIDTAGLREKTQAGYIEKIGIDISKKAIDDSNLVLYLEPFNNVENDEDREILSLIKEKTYIKVYTKCDLDKNKINEKSDGIYISSKEKINIEKLKNEIKNKIGQNINEETDFITNERQQECLKKALNSLEFVKEGIKNKEIQDMILIDLKTVLLELGEIKGEVVTDDILDNIFKNFCIGK